jgi:4-hydroxybenzoate polyprenyltransferase
MFTSMCTFIINDLDDIERDKINHPDRPLPSGRVTPFFATCLYFACLAAALLTTRVWVKTSNLAFLYYLGIVIAISYRYVVMYVPLFKPLYVASASTLPIWIVSAYYPADRAPRGVAIALLLFVFGREMCKDVPDRAGDSVSYLHRVNINYIATLALTSQAAGLSVLCRRIVGSLDVAVLLIMAACLALAAHRWFRHCSATQATAWMKAVMFLGLYFLL